LGLYFSAYPGTNERRTGLLPVLSRAAKNVDSSVELGSEISGSFLCYNTLTGSTIAIA
jgi:hypothetical protein